MISVAVTGGIGEGKSTVLSIFNELGAKTWNADSAARTAIETNRQILENIKNYFGLIVFEPDGRLNRKVLAERVIHSAEERRWLNQLIHPLVIRNLMDELMTVRNDGSVKIFAAEIPLLFETAASRLFDRVITVTADKKTKIKRLCKRDGDNAIKYKFSQAQLSNQERNLFADWVISTNKPKLATKYEIYRIWALLNNY